MFELGFLKMLVLAELSKLSFLPLKPNNFFKAPIAGFGLLKFF